MFTLSSSGPPSPRVTLALFLTLGFAAVNHVEAALGSDQQQTRAGVKEDYATINNFLTVKLDPIIDKNLEAIHEALLPLDPLELKDLDFPVTKKIYMHLHNGWLQNLSLLKRISECNLQYTQKQLVANLSFGWESISVDYRYRLKMLFMTRRGDLHLVLSQLKLNIIIKIDFNTYQVLLTRMEFIENGKIKISLEGHISDKIYNILIKAIANASRNLVFKTIQKKMTELIQHEIDDINQTIDGHHHTHQFTFVNLVAQNNNSSSTFIC